MSVVKKNKDISVPEVEEVLRLHCKHTLLQVHYTSITSKM